MPVSRKNILFIAMCLCIIGLFAVARFMQLQSTDIPHIPVHAIDSAPVVPTDDTILNFKEAPPLVITDNVKTLATSTPTDDITAKAYIVGDVKTGTIYLERNAAKPLPVASMSKLITAIVVTDTLSPTTTVSISSLNTDVASDTSRLSAGETFTMHELLYPMLLNSSNVAAEALASTTDRKAFLDLMSSYAWEVGAPTAFFADPSGLDKHNVASAKDLFSLARYLYDKRPDILELTRVASTSVATTTSHGAHTFFSIHPFIQDPRFVGGKTGRTSEAGDTMMTIMHIKGHDIACILLGAGYNQRAHETTILLDRVEGLLK